MKDYNLRIFGLFVALGATALMFQNCAEDIDISDYTNNSSSGSSNIVPMPPPNAPTLNLQLNAYDSVTLQNVVTVPEDTALTLIAAHESIQGSLNYTFSSLNNGTDLILYSGGNSIYNLGTVGLGDNGTVYKVVVNLNDEFSYEATYTLSVSREPIVLTKSNCQTTPNHNNYETDVIYQTPNNHFIFGEMSSFSSLFLDRVFRNTQCEMRDNRLGAFVKSETTAHPNSTGYLNIYGNNVNFICPTNKFLTGHDSVFFGRDLGDRRYRYYCSSIKNPSTNISASRANCSWSGYVNAYRANVNYTCPDNKILAGIQSGASFMLETHRDRRFNFYCCDAIPAQ